MMEEEKKESRMARWEADESGALSASWQARKAASSGPAAAGQATTIKKASSKATSATMRKLANSQENGKGRYTEEGTAARKNYTVFGTASCDMWCLGMQYMDWMGSGYIHLEKQQRQRPFLVGISILKFFFANKFGERHHCVLHVHDAALLLVNVRGVDDNTMQAFE